MSAARAVSAAEQMYFGAFDNITNALVQKINAETVRVDISCWYLTEHSISIALINKFKSGVPVRLIGDRGSIFEIDPLTKREFYWLANQGLPIRLRVNPTWTPEIDHWKATIFAGQNLVAFGSANYTPFELAPASPTNYKDETVLFTDDAAIVNAFKTKFDQLWNDTTPEPESVVPSPPYFKNWNEACVTEPLGCDFFQQNPSPAPMTISTARLEPNYPLPPELVWGQGPSFNNRLIQEINKESTFLQFVIYRLTVANITDALLNKQRAGVPMQLFIEPNEYLNRKWPEFWLTHANIDKLWAAGVPIKQRLHDGLTHMKTLVTSSVATNASSNYASAWQRDVDYFIPAATKPAIYQALKNRVTAMWNDTAAFTAFVPQPPDAPVLVSPASGATGVSPSAPLVWNIAAFAVSYDVYVGTTDSNMTLVGNVPAQLVNNPPTTYSWTPPAPLQPGTRYVWKVISRTNATPVNPNLVASSGSRAFTTGGAAGPPSAPSTPSPSDGASGVGTSPTLGWSNGAVGTTYSVAFGTTTPPPQVVSGLSSASYAPGPLAPNTTYFWRVTAATSGGTTAGPIWSFATGAGGGTAVNDVVIYAGDVAPQNLHGLWSQTADATAAGGTKLSSADAGGDTLAAPLPNPTNYFETTFQASSDTRYRVWVRVKAIADSKFNDSVFLQYSDSVDSGGNATYRIGTPSAVTLNLWTCATCQSFGWGWQRNAYWLGDTGDVWFQNSGTHTIRVQVREDGAEIDQIVLSPVTYATNAPGPVSNDNTIVAKSAQTPGAPGSPSPANAATAVNINPTLTWTAANATSYDVSFGTTNPPPLAVSGAASASFTPPALNNATTYFWRIVARNASGSTTGAVWSFTTSTAGPATPDAPTPADGATGVPTNVTLTWSATGATTYDVLFGTTDPPSQVASGLTSASYTPPGLTAGTTYFWQIVAHNSGGANQGPQWAFTTAAAAQPQPPTPPATPSPANGASGVDRAPTLTWVSNGATSYDVRFGTVNPPPLVGSNLATASFRPACECSPSLGPEPLDFNTKYYWQVVAHGAAGDTTGPVWSFTTQAAQASGDIVIYANDIPAANLHGLWTTASDATSPSGVKLVTADTGYASTNAPLASPLHYVDATFDAPAGTPFRLWMRMQALNNSKFNDSLWVQFSDAIANGTAAYPLNSASALSVNLAADTTGAGLNGWGWQNSSYWLTQPTTFTFAASGTHTIRIQLREDGVQLDQIVLSSGTYLNTPPGPISNDQTIVGKTAASEPPAVPSAPAPADAATGVGTTVTLNWTSDRGQRFDVYFGTTNPPPAVATRQDRSYTPAALAPNTTYFWQIVAHNPVGPTTGPVWTFTTAGSATPTTPSSPSPAPGAAAVALGTSLTWTASGATSYDVSFGTVNPPPVVAQDLAASSYAPTMAAGTTYFWRITARNAAGTTTGPLWSFTTATQPPSAPASPAPADGAVGVDRNVTLAWTASGATSYEVAFGTTNPPTAVVTTSSPSYTPASLAAGTTYFWQVVARNGGATTAGAVWSFTTAQAAPATPGTPSPSDGATGIATNASLTWAASGATTFDVRFGTTNPPPTVAENLGVASYSPALVANTGYFWQIVARNSAGSTTGPVWSFTTATATPAPPAAPTVVSPSDGATGQGTSVTISWSANGATSYEVRVGTSPTALSAVHVNYTSTSTSLSALDAGRTYYWQIVASNGGGSTTGPIWSFSTAAATPAPAPEIVIYASDIPADALHGAWTSASDPTSPNGVKLVTTDAGFASTNGPVASPVHFVDVSFNADAGTSYTMWLRVKALNNSKFNDSLFIQWSDALADGSPVYPLNSTSALTVNLATDAAAASLNGWGWQNGAYWLSQSVTVRFATTGVHTMRIQVREDGVELDQIVLSSSRYLTAAPGGVTNDVTIVPKP